MVKAASEPPLVITRTNIAPLVIEPVVCAWVTDETDVFSPELTCASSTIAILNVYPLFLYVLYEHGGKNYEGNK